MSESFLRAVIANIPAHTERALPCLAELVDHAFALAHQQAGHDPSNAPSGICTKNRQARILYSVEDKVEVPIKVVLYQDVPAVQIQRVVVDLQTETVQCEGRPSLPMELQQIERARQETKLYLQASLKNLRNIWKSRANDVAHPVWQDFLRRLESNGISSAQSQVCADSPFFEKPCPSCEVLTTLCTSCYAVICLSWDCPVSKLIPFQSCSRDTYKAACLPCLQNARAKPPPSFGQCPECNLWFCNQELTWCLGQPKKIANYYTSVREHPPKPIVCSYCDLGQAVSECANEGCWSREGRVKSLRICQSCSPGGGISCACEDVWICDNCKVPPMPNYPNLKQCPRCKRAYCVRECEYIQFCAECGRTTLCDDCAEEDRSAFAGLDEPEVQEVELVSACHTGCCSKKVCEECLEGLRCAGCDQTDCEGGLCWDCDRYFCENCMRYWSRYDGPLSVSKYCFECCQKILDMD